MSDLRSVELDLIERLEPYALQCPDDDFDWDTWVLVSDFLVRAASWCQASVAGPDDGFEPAIFNTFKALAKTAAAEVGRLDGDVRSALLDVVRRARADDSSVAPWLADYLIGADTPELVATVHRAGSWLERTLAVLDERDFDRYVIDNRLQWDHPAGGLRLRGAVDLVEEGSSRPVVVFPSVDDSRLEQAGYLSLVHGLSQKGAAPSVLVVSHSTGSVASYDRGELAERAIGATERAVAAVLARGGEPLGLERRPSYFTCQDCHWFDT
ncbi:MAG: hypothetical protein ACR2QE_14565, partial [Acidimicrobiales bacterium]